MRYECYLCGEGGGTGTSCKVHPHSFNCHQCGGRDSMWPEKQITEYKAIKFDRDKLQSLVDAYRLGSSTDHLNEPGNSLCYEYRMYDPQNDVVTYHLTYDRARAYEHDQFAIPLYVQTVQPEEFSVKVLLHQALRTLCAVEGFFKNDIPRDPKFTKDTVSRNITSINKKLRKAALVYGKIHPTVGGNGGLQINTKNNC